MTWQTGCEAYREGIQSAIYGMGVVLSPNTHAENVAIGEQMQAARRAALELVQPLVGKIRVQVTGHTHTSGGGPDFIAINVMRSDAYTPPAEEAKG